ncbi:MAG: hypothetical protein ACK5LO_08995 [Leucobacter sp.]
MSNNLNTSLSSRVWRFAAAVLGAALALWGIVEIIKVIWPWLLGIGMVVVIVYALVIVVRWSRQRKNW